MSHSASFEVRTESYLSQYHQIDAELLFFRRSQTYEGKWQNIDVYGQFWVLITAEVPANAVYYHRQGERKNLQGFVAIYVPPFSILELEILVPNLVWDAYVSRKPLTSRNIDEATQLEWDDGQVYSSRAELEKFLVNASEVAVVGKVEGESSLARQIKLMLDAHLGSEIAIHQIADKLKISDSSLTRIFRRAYGISPLVYRNKMRIFESMSKLLVDQQSVTSVGYDVGFNDLGRFHKQFKKYAGATPAQYKFRLNKTI